VESPRTVFVIGAGASVPYGLPTGAELREKLLLWTSSTRVKEWNDAFLTGVEPFTEAQVLRLCRVLELAPFDTIDEFLLNHPNLAAIGKSLLAYHLAWDEHYAVTKTKPRWWRDFANAFVIDRDSRGFRDVRIVSFNYDRIAEHYLAMYCHTTGYHSDRSLDSWLDEWQGRISYIHGRLPTEYKWSETDCRFGEVITPAEAARRASELLVLSHDSPTTHAEAEVARAKELVESARELVFLGFGYAPANLNRLGLNDGRVLSGVRGICTAIGISQERQSRVHRLFGQGAVWLNDIRCEQFCSAEQFADLRRSLLNPVLPRRESATA
jgi:hypothetical protein